MTESKYFLDTNIFLRLLMKDEVVQAKECERLIRRLMDGKIIGLTSTLVLTELVWTGLSYYKLPKVEIVQILRAIISIKYLTIKQEFDYLLALEYYERHAIKFVDACLAAHHCLTDKNVIMVSYDRDFDKLPIKRLEPKQIL